MGRLVRERVALLVPLALRQEQDLGVEGPEHLPWRVDGVMFSTALDNLLENALCYTPDGGTITLRLGQDPERFWCEVEDNGPGISAEFRERAFDRFTRAPDVTKPGAGLGLAIVQRAVELHGGSIKLLDPESGQGLLARIELSKAH
jgi:two-component system sensor histidine kinase QseC